MKKFCLSLLLLVAIGAQAWQEPNAINFNNQGAITLLYYNFQNSSAINPLSGIYLDGTGKIAKVRLDINGTSFLINEYGVPDNSFAASFSVEYNSQSGRIEKIKRGYDILYRFSYDMDGRLDKVKDDDYNESFQLHFDMDGRLSRIEEDSDYLLRFSYNFDGQFAQIKDDDYNVIWKLYYDFDNRLERIKDGDYNERISLNYQSNGNFNLNKSNSTTDFHFNATHIDYLQGQFNGNGGFNHPQHNDGSYNGGGCIPQGSQVVFYLNGNFMGQEFEAALGGKATLPNYWNDKISSIRVPNGFEIIIFEQHNFQGDMLILKGDWSATYSSDYWNDRISSFIIRKKY